MRRPWEKHKAEMVRLYIDESKKLDDVMAIMQDMFNFKASKRAYRFHFDHWGIEKYNCKKRNERKIRRKQPLPSPPLTSSPSQSSSITTSRGSRQGYANETFDFSQQSQDYFHDAFAIQSLPQNTGLAFPDMSYSPVLNDAPTQSMPGLSTVTLGHRPPPTPEPEGVPQLEQITTSRGMLSLGPKGPLATPHHSLLPEAIRRQDPQQVRELVHYGVRLDVADDHGSYPLHNAVTLPEPRITRILLDAGADPNAPDRHGRTPLFLATISSLKMLLEREYPPNLCHRDDFGETVLHSLLQDQFWYTDPFRREAVKCLLGHLRDPAAAVLNTPNSRGLTPFHVAVSCSGAGFTSALIEPLAWMLARNPDVRIPIPGSNLPLCVLVEKLQAFREAQPGSKDPMGPGEWKALHALLLRFLDLSPPRMYPARVLRALLSPGLLFLSASRLWEFVQRLVRQGIADVSSPDEQGRTALLDVLGVGYVAVAAQGAVVEERVTALVKGLFAGTGGHALGLRDRQGRVAWDVYASRWSGHREVLGMLAAKRAEVGADTREWEDVWGGEMKVSRVVGWGGGGRSRMSYVLDWSDQGLLADNNKSTVKQEY